MTHSFIKIPSLLFCLPLLLSLFLLSCGQKNDRHRLSDSAVLPLITLERDYWPTKNWQYKKVSQGAAWESFREYAFPSNSSTKKSSSIDTSAVLVIHKGYVVLEHYADSMDKESLYPIDNITSVMVNALFGVSQRAKKFNMKDEIWKFASFFADDWDSRAISIENVLQMSSTLNWFEGEQRLDFAASRGEMLYTRGRADMAKFTGQLKSICKPNTCVQDGALSPLLLMYVLKNMLSEDSSYDNYPWDVLFDRIGMKRVVWERDATGVFAPVHAYTTAQDLAKLGFLYLNNGVWQDSSAQSRVLTGDWVQFSRQASPAYQKKESQIEKNDVVLGALWKLNVPIKLHKIPVAFPTLPRDTFYQVGLSGTGMWVIPSWDMVVIRFAKDGKIPRNFFPLLVKNLSVPQN